MMSRPRRKTAEEALEFFATLGSDIESDGSDDEYSDEETNNLDQSSQADDTSDIDPQPSTSTAPPPPPRHVPPSRKRARREPPSSSSTSSSSSTTTAATTAATTTTTDWTEDLTGYGAIPPFTAQPALNVPPDTNTPLDFFSLIFTQDILRLIKAETNRYAASELSRRQLPPDSLYKNWTTVTLVELQAFFAIWCHMAIVKKPCIKDYWSENEMLHTSFAPKLMSRNRFLQILGLLHLNNNDTYIAQGDPGHDPLHKLRPIVDHLSQTFKTLVTPAQKVVIDEAICPWRGKLRFRVYMKDKPNKWGIKIYVLCESQSAYVFDFEIYCAHPELSNKPVDVCHRLMNPLLAKGYILYTDNYYTCPTLSENMLLNQTMSVGTVRSNRLGMPPDLAQVNLQTGEIAFRRKDKLVALRWQDKKSVNMLTTIHDPRETAVVTSRAQQKRKPVAVQDYTLNMKGVDRSDQLMAYLPINRRTLKWWKKMFVHLFSLILVQSSILYNKKMKLEGKKTMYTSKFVQRLGIELAEKVFQDRAAAARDLTPTTLDRLNRRCFMKYIPASEKKARPTRVCKVCSERARRSDAFKKRKETSFWCPFHQVPLCPDPCFELFHTKKHYETV